MKKVDIINLANAGVQGATNHTLDAKDAYKVLKFRRALLAAFEGVREEIKANQAEAGIEDPQAFDKERADLRALESRSADQDKRLADLDAKFQRFAELQKELLADEAELACITMPYASWHALQVENEKTFPALSDPYVEDTLENVLWAAPEE